MPIHIRPDQSSPGLKAVDALLRSLIPDAEKSATNPRYRHDPDTVVLRADDPDQTTVPVVGALTAHSDRPDLAVSPPALRNMVTTPGQVRVITQMAVHPNYQGRGIGARLLDSAEDQFRRDMAKLSLVFVDDRSSASAQNFYTAQGYTRASGHTVAFKRELPLWLPPETGLYRHVGSSRTGWFFYKHL